MKKKKFIIGIVVLLAVIALATPASALDQTKTGFYYPIGEKDFDQACGGWLFRDNANRDTWPDDQDCSYFDGLYHIGVDMMTRTYNRNNENSHVYSVAAGKVIYISTSSSWGATNGRNNSVVFIHHKTKDGIDFVGNYGHIQVDSSKIYVGSYVRSGQYLGYTGMFLSKSNTHLHFGISLGTSYRPTNVPYYGWGRAQNDYWDKTDPVTGEEPFTNGYVDPVEFIETHEPDNYFLPDAFGFKDWTIADKFIECMLMSSPAVGNMCPADELKEVIDEPTRNFIIRLASADYYMEAPRVDYMMYLGMVFGPAYVESVMGGLGGGPKPRVLGSSHSIFDEYPPDDPTPPDSATLSFQSFKLSSRKKGPWSDDTFHVARGESFYARAKLIKEGRFSKKIRGKVKYYYRPDENDDPDKDRDPYLGSDRFKIRPKETKEKEVTRLRIKEPGTHYLYCRVTWREDREKKEIYSNPIKVVIENPDPAITQLTLNGKTNLLYFDPEESIQVAATVASPGPRLRRNLRLKYYFIPGWHSPQTLKEAKLLKKGNYLANDSIRRGKVDDGEAVTRQTRFNLPNDPGSQYTILVILSGTGKDNQSNNFKTLPLTILDPTTPGDLTFLRSEFLPTEEVLLTALAGEEILTGFTIQNQGQGRSSPAQFLLNVNLIPGNSLDVPQLLPTETFSFTLTALESAEPGNYQLQGEIVAPEDQNPFNNLSNFLTLIVEEPPLPPDDGGGTGEGDGADPGDGDTGEELWIRITEPDPGEHWRCDTDDDEVDIKWESNFYRDGKLTLYYRIDDDEPWIVIEKDVTNDGKRHWNICRYPTVDSHDAQVKVCSEKYEGICGVSPEFYLDRAKGCEEY